MLSDGTGSKTEGVNAEASLFSLASLTLFPQIFCSAKSLRGPYIRGGAARPQKAGAHRQLYSPSFPVVLFVDGAVLLLALHKVGLLFGRGLLALCKQHEPRKHGNPRNADERP